MLCNVEVGARVFVPVVVLVIPVVMVASDGGTVVVLAVSTVGDGATVLLAVAAIVVGVPGAVARIVVVNFDSALIQVVVVEVEATLLVVDVEVEAIGTVTSNMAATPAAEANAPICVHVGVMKFGCSVGMFNLPQFTTDRSSELVFSEGKTFKSPQRRGQRMFCAFAFMICSVQDLSDEQPGQIPG